MILLLGGTSESRQIGQLLQEKNYAFILSTVSEYGTYLAQKVCAKVQKQTLDEEGLITFCTINNIKWIIDATHPFALIVSNVAIKVAQKLHISYIRYEREKLTLPQVSSFIQSVETNFQAVQLARQLGNNILLTIGSRHLESFVSLIQEKNVFVRILPEQNSLQKCFDLGIKPNQIIAMHGPFSKEFNLALYKEKGIEIVVSKESGTNGGTDTKMAACLELGIPMIIIKRPQVDYPNIVYNCTDILSFLEEEQYGISN